MHNGQGVTVWSLFENQARLHPQQTAIVDGELEIDYQRLLQRANAIATALLASGVAPGSLVGVCMNRRWELVATLLGVLRAGCAYVPLDPEYPRERVHYMLEHARAVAAIVDGDEAAQLCAGVSELIRLDDVHDDMGVDLPAPAATDLAYVIYTSGSTGQPKGVAVEHGSVVAMCQSMRELLTDDDLTGVSALASVCFDPSVMEILGTLALGGTVILAQNALSLLDLPAAHRIRTCIIVPSAMQALLTAGSLPDNVRTVVFGGEVLKRSLVDQLRARAPTARLINVYGPTENTVFSTVKTLSEAEESITIGQAVANTRCYILNESLQPVTTGIAGELYLAGDQLARGYLHDEELTQARFIELASNGSIPEQRLYKTGDLCRWLADGEIEFMGRADQQVKIRGFRIELEEIESALESMPGVDGAAVTAVSGGGDHKMLMAYLVSRNAEITREAVRTYLALRLPGHMVPQIVMQLDELPRLPNGKLNRDQLPSFESNEPHAESAPLSFAHRIAGLSQAERHAAVLSVIRDEIASILQLNDPLQVTLEHSFDELGIDSLTAVELSARLADIVDRKLPVSVLLQRLTPAAVADYVVNLLTDSDEETAVEKNSESHANTLAHFQNQIQAYHPPFLVAKTPAWSVADKGILVQELKRLIGAPGHDPYGKLVRTGSGHRGIVADAQTNEERDAIIWTTNLYLGLNRDADVIAEAQSALAQFGTGMGTSAAASGITDLHVSFEQAFAEHVGKPAACLFPTGFTANLGTVAGLLGDNDVVVMDQLCHASIVDGARLSGSAIRTFRHNDAKDLDRVLQSVASPYRTVLVVLEGAYSMGEGAAPVADIVRTAKQYNALVLVDEAHSFGFYGPKGAGICAAQGVTDQVDFIMTTLSKAMGSLGGVIAASAEHVALLKSSARAYIFQASASPADIAAALAALRRLSTDDTLRERLWDTTAYMRQQFTAAGYDLGEGDGPIVTPHFSDKEKLFAIVNGLFKRGVHTSAVTYPIVESGRGRLRFICSAAHTREDVDRTLAALIETEWEVDTAEELEQVASQSAWPDQSRLTSWAESFSTHLKKHSDKGNVATPNLAISVTHPGHTAPITIQVNQGVITRPTHVASDLSHCSLALTDHKAFSSLCRADVQGLLDSVIKGSTRLKGQVEPFIWFIGRLAAWRDVSGPVESRSYAALVNN